MSRADGRRQQPWDRQRAGKLDARTEAVRAVLDAVDGTEEFTAYDVAEATGWGHSETQGVIQLLAELRIIEHVRQERHQKPTDHYGTVYRWIYRFREGPRREIEQRVSNLDTLPCGCHAHIPSGRDDAPEGEMACKYCGAYHSRAIYREVM
jgi:transcription initiation factor IIE alpha subunit